MDKFGRLTIAEQAILKEELEREIPEGIGYDEYIISFEDRLSLLHQNENTKYDILVTAIKKSPSLYPIWNTYDTAIRSDVFRTFSILKDDLRGLMNRRSVTPLAMVAKIEPKKKKKERKTCSIHGRCAHTDAECRDQQADTNK
jgi:hypothetical protein